MIEGNAECQSEELVLQRQHIGLKTDIFHLSINTDDSKRRKLQIIPIIFLFCHKGTKYFYFLFLISHFICIFADGMHLIIYDRWYRMARPLLLALLLMLVSPVTGASQHETAFDSLRHLSSAQLMERGRDYFSAHEAAKALACFTIVSERQGANGEDRLRVRAMNNCGCVYKFLYFDYTQAYNYLTRAYDLCEQYGYNEFLPVIMVNLGDLLNDYGVNYDSKPLARQARHIFDNCIEKAAESKNWELLTTAFFNLANQNYELDLKKYDILFSKEIPDTTLDLAFVRLQYQGIKHVQRGEYAQARQCFERQLREVSTRLEPERDTLAAYMSIAYTYQMEHRYDQSIAYWQQALQLTDQNHIDDQAAGICQQLAANYRLTGDSATANRYHIRYLEKREEMHNNRLSNIAELNYIYELKKEEERARQLEERHHYQQQALIAGALVLLVVLVFAFLLWRKNRELQERNKSLYEKNRQVMKIEADEQNLRKVYSKSSLNDEQRESLTDRIQETLSDPDIICQQDFTLSKLAKLINSNTSYVSQVINEKYGMAFSNLLSSRRIKVACQWMDNPAEYGHLTIEAIAMGTGFKSRTTFVNAFKRETGLKPSEYLRMAIAKDA